MYIRVYVEIYTMLRYYYICMYIYVYSEMQFVKPQLQVTTPLYKLKTINAIATMNANKSTRNNVTINRETCPPYS